MKNDADLQVVRRVLAGSALVLMAVTWRLWTPQTVFPQVPFLAAFAHAPTWFDWGMLSVMLAGLVLAGISRRDCTANVEHVGHVLGFSEKIGTLETCPTKHTQPRPAPAAWRIGLVVFAVALAGSILEDQHRLQPWAYQFGVVALVLAVLPPDRALRWLRILTVSIYFHSAVSKLDASFWNTHGEKLAGALLAIAGAPFETWPFAVRRVVAGMLPVGELLIAAALCVRRTRFAGLCGAVVMHVLLMLAVGPWGLNHKPAVLLWNAFFIFQDVVIFSRLGRSADENQPWDRLPACQLSKNDDRLEADPTRKTSPSDRHEKHGVTDSGGGTSIETRRTPIPQRVVTAMVFAVVVLPLLEPFDLFDHWPAWGLYASRPEQIKVYIHESLRPQLQEAIGNYVAWPPADDPYCRLYIDRWSLDALDVPLYPQGRFQLGIALSLARRFPHSADVRVTIQSSANRWTGERSERLLSGPTEIEAELRRYWLNAFPKPGA